MCPGNELGKSSIILAAAYITALIFLLWRQPHMGSHDKTDHFLGLEIPYGVTVQQLPAVLMSVSGSC